MPQATARKVVREAFLLIRLHADGSVTARQVHVDNAGNYAFSDANSLLTAEDRITAKNLIRNLKSVLEL